MRVCKVKLQILKLYHYYLSTSAIYCLLFLGCEDIIVDSLTIDNLISTMQWSAEAYGSGWVHRQVLNFLKEEFLHIAHSQVLCDLKKDQLMEAISSDFVQVKPVIWL